MIEPIRESVGRARLTEALPASIDSPYPCVSIRDLYEVAQSLAVPITPDEADVLERDLEAIKLSIYPVDNGNFYSVRAADLATPLEELAEAETNRLDASVGVIQMDKYIAAGSDNPAFFRLDVSRNKDDQLVPRVGATATVEEQLEALAKWAKGGGYQEVILVDDVLAFGSTVPPLIERLREMLPDVTFRLLVGIAAYEGEWRGIETVKEQAGIDAEYLVKVAASPAIPDSTLGMTIPVSRDLTIFGGKAGTDDSGARVSYPYFLPFSRPLSSIARRDKFVEGSLELLTFSEDLVRSLEDRLGRQLTVGDMLDNGYAFPSSSLECLMGKLELPSRDTKLADYLSYVRNVMMYYGPAIEEELNKKPDQEQTPQEASEKTVATGSIALQNAAAVL